MTDLDRIKLNWREITYMEQQTEEICLEAVKQSPYALQSSRVQTEEICLLAVEKNGLMLAFVRKQNERICVAAVKQCPDALRYVRNNYFEACVNALRLRALFDPKIEDVIKNYSRRFDF